MAKVILDNNLIMEGNFWDFHPGCHNIKEYGEFNSPWELVLAIQNSLASLNIKYITYKYNYGYNK